MTGWSIPNLLGWAVGLGGGTPSLLRTMNVVIIAVVGYQLLRRRDWLTGAGWALAVLASLGWLMPWYVVWLLPLAALAPDPQLRGVALAFSVFVLATFLPVTDIWLPSIGVNPSGGPVQRAAFDVEWTAQFGYRGDRPDPTGFRGEWAQRFAACRAVDEDCGEQPGQRPA